MLEELAKVSSAAREALICANLSLASIASIAFVFCSLLFPAGRAHNAHPWMPREGCPPKPSAIDPPIKGQRPIRIRPWRTVQAGGVSPFLSPSPKRPRTLTMMMMMAIIYSVDLHQSIRDLLPTYRGGGSSSVPSVSVPFVVLLCGPPAPVCRPCSELGPFERESLAKGENSRCGLF